MKKVFFIVLAVVVSWGAGAWALDVNPLIESRSRFFEESKQIKDLFFSDTKDIIVVSSLWDSCVMTMNQLDAYFLMLGLFNLIKGEEAKRDAFVYLGNWLNEIKKVSLLNIKSLAVFPSSVEARTKLHIERLMGYFTALNGQIDKELSRNSVLQRTLGTERK